MTIDAIILTEVLPNNSTYPLETPIDFMKWNKKRILVSPKELAMNWRLFTIFRATAIPLFIPIWLITSGELTQRKFTLSRKKLNLLLTRAAEQL